MEELHVRFYNSVEKVFWRMPNYKFSNFQWLRMVELGHYRDRSGEGRTAMYCECCTLVKIIHMLVMVAHDENPGIQEVQRKGS